MLESFVSSRIRRTLLEHLLARPAERFYLRGLSKELGLSISPLRRELKRLERSGMLTAVPEGNMLFYAVNAASPAFLQLNSLKAQGSRVEGQAVTFSLQPSAFSPPPAQQHRWRMPLLAGAAAGVIVLLAGGLAYVGMTNQRLSAQVARALNRKSSVTVVATPAASGAMRGSRWQVVPGGFGGSFSGGSDESY